MVSVLESGASGPGSSPGRGHCVVFLGKTLYFHGASPHRNVGGEKRPPEIRLRSQATLHPGV